jgi:hypothetical protein
LASGPLRKVERDVRIDNIEGQFCMRFASRLKMSRSMLFRLSK